MRPRYRILIAALLAAALFFALQASSIADAGGFSGDTDYGGSDWGSSDWGSSSWGGSDWGGSDWGGSNWGSSGSGGTIWYGGNDGSGSGAYSGGNYGGLGLLGCLSNTPFWIVLLIILLIVYFRMKRSGAGATAQQMYTASFEGTGIPLTELKAKDPNFNEQALLEMIGNRYIQMQAAWESKKWESMRAFMTDALYNQMDRQLDKLRTQGITNHIDRIAVLETKIQKYMVEGDDDVLVVRLQTRIVDYYTNDKTGQIVGGSNKKELFMTYDWKLTRNKDRKTLKSADLTSVSCPNCGAPLSINHTGKCEYCGSVVTLSDHDWALSAIKAISQRSAS